MNTAINFFKAIIPILALITLVGGGIWLGQKLAASRLSQPQTESDTTEDGEASAKDAGPAWWTCSMHPQIKLPSGDMKCPICFMELIPLEAGASDESIPEISFSERARFLAEVATAPVERREATKSVRLVGKIATDETRLSIISARVAGRLERLFVDYTGIEVRAGDHLFELYSPELYSAQREYIQSYRTVESLQRGRPEQEQGESDPLIQAARAKLLRWGMTEEQVEAVSAGGEISDTLTVYSPASGIVIRREGTLGMYVEEGTPIYAIADLSEVWLLAQAYESDLVWLHFGQKVSFEVEAYPGELFEGKLSFISPVLDERSRTISIRVNVPNPEGKLKPGMFAHATIQSHPSKGGKILTPDLAGKWMCPMHPEIVEETLGSCPVCGMRLETTKSLGYESTPTSDNLPLVIPDTAPLLTGKRAIVYVEEKRDDGIYYIGKQVVLGPHANDNYIVESGLAEGERVVTHGNFKIDSALQLLSRPSMMTPGKEETAPTEADPPPTLLPDELVTSARKILAEYILMQEALAADSYDQSRIHVTTVAADIRGLPDHALEGDAHMQWMEDIVALKKAVDASVATADLEELRASFEPLSDAVLKFVQHFGNPLDLPVKETFCPMALDDGAFWLQTGKDIANPYYGASMLRCGEFKKTYEGQGVAVQ